MQFFQRLLYIIPLALILGAKALPHPAEDCTADAASDDLDIRKSDYLLRSSVSTD